MTACCTHQDLVGPGASAVDTAEVTLSEMTARAAHVVVSWVEAMHRRWTTLPGNARALETLRGLDDRHLADIGLGRDDLTEDGLAEAAERRDLAAALLKLRRSGGANPDRP